MGTYVPDTKQEQQEMLREIGFNSFDEMFSHIPEEVKLKDGADEYLRRLKEDGVKMGVATALTSDLYEPVLRHNGIYEFFDAFVSSHEPGRSKAFPDVYLLAAERIGVSPADCVVFEDIRTGVLGAKAGGFTTCGVYEPWSFGEQDGLAEAADYYIRSFVELLS